MGISLDWIVLVEGVLDGPDEPTAAWARSVGSKARGGPHPRALMELPQAHDLAIIRGFQARA
jgi:hypothetical protein